MESLEDVITCCSVSIKDVEEEGIETSVCLISTFVHRISFSRLVKPMYERFV